MLELLRIKNLAVIESISVDFTQGLNLLTGETGAGKSIILKSISFLGGTKISTDLIRTNSESCEVEGLFAINNTQENREKLSTILDSDTQSFDQSDLEKNSSDIIEIIIRRTLDKNGRSRIFINDKLSTISKVEIFFNNFVEITGQHSQISLLDQKNQLNFIDRFSETEDLLFNSRELYKTFKENQKKLESLKLELSKDQSELDYLKTVQKELAALKPKKEEKEELQAKIKRFTNIENTEQQLNLALQLLGEANFSQKSKSMQTNSANQSIQQGALSAIKKSYSILEAISAKDESLMPLSTKCSNLYDQISDLISDVEENLQSLDINSSEIEIARDRISEYSRLERKLNLNNNQFVEYLEEITSKINLIDGGEIELKKLQAALDKSRSELLSVHKKITEHRKNGAEKLISSVKKNLKSLNLGKSELKVNFEICEPTPNGSDKVSILLSTNPGEEPKEISKVASGGELSRILLALKSALTGDSSNDQIQIFDEIDTGIGGSVAQAVGEKLKLLSKSSQLIVITHAPQIAVFGDNHLKIIKTQILQDKNSSTKNSDSNNKERTFTTVEKLDRDQRISEVARMLAGKEVSKNFEASARELFESTGSR